jgi:hypothetical protein
MGIGRKDHRISMDFILDHPDLSLYIALSIFDRFRIED